MEQTLILVKPDAFGRDLTGEILARFERKGLKLKALRLLIAPRETAETHYAEHAERPFFGELVDFITGGPLVAAIFEGQDAIKAARQLIGATNPLEAAPGSIRGDYAIEVGTNMVHGSDSPESAAREIGIWFPETSGLSLVLASASPRRRAILEQLGIALRRRARGRRGAQRGRPARGRPRERAPQGARRSPGDLVLGVRHPRRARRRHLRQAGLAERGRGDAARAARAHAHRLVGARRHRPRRARGGDTRDLRRASPTTSWPGTSPPTSGGARPAATRSRGAGAALVRAHRRRLPQRRRACPSGPCSSSSATRLTLP